MTTALSHPAPTPSPLALAPDAPDCPRCEGSGSVVVDYSPWRSSQHSTDCPERGCAGGKLVAKVLVTYSVTNP